MPDKHSKKEPEELEEVYRAFGMMEAEVVKGSLEASGIPVLLQGESQMLAFSAAGMGEVRVLVPAERAAEARELLDADTEEKGNEEGKADSNLLR